MQFVNVQIKWILKWKNAHSWSFPFLVICFFINLDVARNKMCIEIIMHAYCSIFA